MRGSQKLCKLNISLPFTQQQSALPRGQTGLISNANRKYNVVVSRRSPVHRPAAFWIVLGLIVFGFIIFLPALKQLPFDEFLPKIQSEPQKKVISKRVWVSRRSGYYYCPSSPAYGALQPGEYMNRTDANQKGFRPAPNVPCD